MVPIKIEKGVSLAPYTTFKVGGKADYFVTVSTLEELQHALDFAKKKSLQTYLLAGGSNVLFSDEGYRGLVIRIFFKGILFNKLNSKITEVICAAGEVWDDMVLASVKNGLYGIENLSGIPGSVGATPVQNVGAYGTEIADVLSAVDVFDIEKQTIKKMNARQCGFGYRTSIFKMPKGRNLIVLKVYLHLEKNGKPNLSYKDLKKYFENTNKPPSLINVRNAVLEIRKKKFPDLNVYGTAGSFFKNPIITTKKYQSIVKKYNDVPKYFVNNTHVKVPAGWLVEHIADGKNIKKTDVGPFKNQALVLINYNKATAKDIIACADLIAKIIFEKTGIKLEREVRVVN